MTEYELFNRIEEMIESDDMTLKQGIRLMLGGITAINKRLDVWTTWQKDTDKRLDVLESQDKKVIAKWGAIGVIAGAIVSGTAIIIVALL